MISLSQAPQDKQLKIVEFQGGHGLRRRLMALGLHKNDIVELDSRSILRGPLLIRHVNSDSSLALGRGIANKIIVEILDK